MLQQQYQEKWKEVERKEDNYGDNEHGSTI